MKADRTFSEAIEALYQEGYGKNVVDMLQSFKTSDIGYRLGGTHAEHSASRYLAEEFRKAGLSDVQLEEIPTVACDFKGAYVYVDGAKEGKGDSIKRRHIIASQIAGYKGTSEDGITAQVVYVGTGRKHEYDAVSTDPEFFVGKIVLVDSTFDTLWVGWQAAEASVRGCSGMILTAALQITDGGYFSYAPDMLAGQDGQGASDFLPLVYIAQQDGKWLKDYITSKADAGEEAVVTMFSDADIMYPEDGAIGYNVTAKIPGNGDTDKIILVAAHQDAHLLAAADDTGAVAATMIIARALMMSGYKPYYTIQFIITSSEEFGVSDTIYDWQHGMFEAITGRHKDWAEKAIVCFNNEVMAEKGGHIDCLCGAEMTEFMLESFETLKKERPEILPNGTELIPVVFTVGDDWVTNAAGIPSIDLTCKRYDYMTRYHTTYDSEDNLDYELIGKVAEFVCMMVKVFDTEAFPFGVLARAEELQNLYSNEAFSGAESGMVCPMTKMAVINAGVDASIADDMETAINKYVSAAKNMEIRKQNIAEEEIKAFNERLMKVMQKTLTSFIGLGIATNTIYPYQQTLSDTLALKAVIEELKKENVDKSEVINRMCKVGEVDFGYFSMVRTGMAFSREAYYRMLELYKSHDTDWSCMGKLSPILDLCDQWEYVLNPDNREYSHILEKLKNMYDQELNELNTRILKITKNIYEIVGLIEQV